ncbi:trehalose-phosphatase [Vibrio nitrifigilis]|uniref:Trehalose 6-phosphate phosphatase n=1 Tax=Vibrio nitrifigilis TaxID=2789781 RepID=A0ABS0GDV9_9VIBR|nr:trehalose-phosphatase [Vibrio nitrifigilis]MBF9000443.1 trehalose-phosphatase [Vibrio nitrifigilis]
MMNTLPKLPFEQSAIFLDFDGTLVDLKPTPDAVIVTDKVKNTLRQINRETNQASAIITGRSVDSLDSLLAMPEFKVSGSHGMQFRFGNSHTVNQHPDVVALPQSLLDECLLFCAEQQLLLEDKPLTLAIHYRDQPFKEQMVEHFLNDVINRYSTLKLAVQNGKFIRELKPEFINKASALTYFMNCAEFEGRVPWYFGDDVTDEDAFKWVNNHHGVSVKIGEGASCANYRLESPDGVIEFFQAMLEKGGNQ